MKLINFFLLLAFALFPLGQLPTFSLAEFGFAEVRIHVFDLLIGLIAFLWWSRKFLKKKTLPKITIRKPLLLFTAWAMVTLLVNVPLLESREVLIAFLYLIRFFAFASLAFVSFEIFSENKKKKFLFKSLMIIGSTSSGLSLLQYFFFPDTRFLSDYQWDPHYFRAIGTFLDPTFLGMILVLTLILTFFEFERKKRKLFLFLGSITYLSLALTYSRASYLAFICGSGAISFFKKSPKIFLVACLLLGMTIFLLPRPGGEGVKLERESTIEARIRNWKQSIGISKDHLLFGVGFNAYRPAQQDYGFLGEEDWQVSHAGAGADSSFLFALATTGVFGLILFLLFWWKTAKIHPILTVSSIALTAHSFFSNSLFYPWVMFWIFILVGALAFKEKNSL